MTATELLCRLEAVRPRGSGKWIARCSAHQDKSPSLSITEGDKGLLLKCWAGCRLEEICTSLSIRPADLFFNALDSDPQQRRAAARKREQDQQVRERHADQQGTLIDALREADSFIQSRRGIDISTWVHDRLHDELNALADAYLLLEGEALHG